MPGLSRHSVAIVPILLWAALCAVWALSPARSLLRPLTPPDVADDTQLLAPHLVLVIKSAPREFHRRELARRTWLHVPAVRSGRVRYTFLSEPGDAPDVRAERPARDVLLTPFGPGKRAFILRAFHAIEWAVEHHPSFRAYAFLDDDVFTCVDHILSDLLHPTWPAERWAWGQYFCGAGGAGARKIVADENFLLLSADVVRGLLAFRPLLRLVPNASFAAHFGLWQHVLDLQILDDQERVSPAPGTAFHERIGDGADFCASYVHAHYTRDVKEVEAAHAFVMRRTEPYPPPPVGRFGDICAHDPSLQDGVLFDPATTSMGPDSRMPVVVATKGYSFTRAPS